MFGHICSAVVSLVSAVLFSRLLNLIIEDYSWGVKTSNEKYFGRTVKHTREQARIALDCNIQMAIIAVVFTGLAYFAFLSSPHHWILYTAGLVATGAILLVLSLFVFSLIACFWLSHTVKNIYGRHHQKLDFIDRSYAFTKRMVLRKEK